MIWLLIPVVAVFAVLAYWAGRRLALRRAAGAPTAHSRPEQHGYYALIWVAAPAIAVTILAGVFAGPLAHTLLTAGAPAVVSELEPIRQEAFWNDARLVGAGEKAFQTWPGDLGEALTLEAARSARITQTLTWGSISAAILGALMGGLFAWSQIRPTMRARNRVEGWIGGLLFACSAVAILTTVGIVFSLLWDSLRFFQAVPVFDFLFGTQWSPQIAIRADQVGSSGAFGAVPLFAGTFLIMLIAMCVAAPVGLFSAIYLSEYASPLSRGVVKPVLEILAGVPTVVYGFFAALTVGPAFREFFNGIGAMLVGGPLDGVGQYLMLVQNQMALVAGAVMGIMLIPFVSSLSDDIINAVPQSLRDGSYAMGATKSETVTRVLLPAALPGIAGALLLAMSRAIGETMIVTMEFDSPKTLAAFGLGLTLFLVTLMLNIVAQRIVQTYREQYD